MAIDLGRVEALATDQASLKAAAGLAKPGKWSGVGGSADGALIWGECAGSGANPYRVMADLRDLGNKCTCPSRKFPCQHVLALLWLNAETVVAFPPGEIPAWVSDWLDRRRGGAPAGTAAAKPASDAPKDVRAAQLAEPEAPEDPKAAARREAASAKRAEDTERAIAAQIVSGRRDGDAHHRLEQHRIGLRETDQERFPRCGFEGEHRRILLVEGAVEQDRLDPQHRMTTRAAIRQRGDDQNKRGRKRLRDAGCTVHDRFLSPGALRHNKFLVAGRRNATAFKPAQVWTGSTNWTPTGLCTQLNNGILLDNAKLAAQFELLKAAGDSVSPALLASNNQPASRSAMRQSIAGSPG
nr:SWIM zinc finger family protein [Sphingomonas sp.]